MADLATPLGCSPSRTVQDDLLPCMHLHRPVAARYPRHWCWDPQRVCVWLGRHLVLVAVVIPGPPQDAASHSANRLRPAVPRCPCGACALARWACEGWRGVSCPDGHLPKLRAAAHLRAAHLARACGAQQQSE
jgi:hypothetical protein